MPDSFSLAASMNLEHSIKEGSHERYPVHLQCLRNIKKIKYPDYQAMTYTSQEPILDLTGKDIKSMKDIEQAFHALNLCPKENNEEIPNGREETRGTSKSK